MNIKQKKIELVYYKGWKCFDCGVALDPRYFQFDHRNPYEKSFTIASSMSKTLEELKTEVDKCDLLCPTCHVHRTIGDKRILAKMSAVHKGRKHSPEEIAKNSAKRKGVPLSAEHRKKISIANKGRKVSEKSRIAMGNAHRGKKLSAEHKEHLKDAAFLRTVAWG